MNETEPARPHSLQGETDIHSLQGETDIVRELRADHEWLQTLTHRAAEAQDAERRSELGEAFRYHWRAHAEAEERCVYSLLEGHIQAADWVHISRSQQARIDRILATLVRQDPQNVNWHARAAELAQAMDDHSHTEEIGLIARLPVLLAKDESQQLGQLYSQLRMGTPSEAAATVAPREANG